MVTDWYEKDTCTSVPFRQLSIANNPNSFMRLQEVCCIHPGYGSGH
jgi:hypothetical protein